MIQYKEDGYIEKSKLIEPNIIESILKSAPLHNHDHYEFFIIIEGACKHIINNAEQILKQGHVLFIRPQDFHNYEILEDKDCRFINIPCRNELINDLFEYFKNVDRVSFDSLEVPNISVLSSLEVEKVIEDIEHFKMLTTIDTKKATFFIKAKMCDLFLKYFLNNQTEIDKNLPLWFENLLFKMQKKENFTNGLAIMYKFSGRSVGHLNRVFRQYLNQTPTEYINNVRLEYAKNLLITTNKTVIEIAMESGFDNLSHFYHKFKHRFKKAPLEMRV